MFLDLIGRKRRTAPPPFGSRGSFAVLLLLVAGCGDSLGEVSGRVYYKDQLLREGRVIFVSADGKKSATALIGHDGSYRLDKAPLGPVKIAVHASATDRSRPRGAVAKEKMLKMLPKDLPPGAEQSPRFHSGDAATVRVPAKYADPDKSDLTYTVTSGGQEHDIRIP